MVAVDQCRPKTGLRLEKCTKLLTTAPQDVVKEMGSASCIALLPGVTSGGFLLLGGIGGKGVIVCRSGEKWGPPSMIRLSRVTIGPQLGIERGDYVLIATGPSAASALLSKETHFDASASFKAGHIGGNAQSAYSNPVKSHVYSSGAFVGASIDIGALGCDEAANKKLWGEPRSCEQSATGSPKTAAPVCAADLIKALASLAP